MHFLNAHSISEFIVSIKMLELFLWKCSFCTRSNHSQNQLTICISLVILMLTMHMHSHMHFWYLQPFTNIAVKCWFQSSFLLMVREQCYLLSIGWVAFTTVLNLLIKWPAVSLTNWTNRVIAIMIAHIKIRWINLWGL